MSGDVVMLNEVRFDSGYIRVTGQVDYIDAIARFCVISHRGRSEQLLVDLSKVDFSELRIDSMCQFIGDVKPTAEIKKTPIHGLTSSLFYLDTKILRIVNGLDLNLFEQATMIRRDYLNKERKIKLGISKIKIELDISDPNFS
eukprot:gene14353-19250_t